MDCGGTWTQELGRHTSFSISGFCLSAYYDHFQSLELDNPHLIKEGKAWSELSWGTKQRATTTADFEWLTHLSINQRLD